MAGLMANGPIRIKRGKEWVNGPRKPKELSSKLIEIIRGNKEVNGLS